MRLEDKLEEINFKELHNLRPITSNLGMLDGYRKGIEIWEAVYNGKKIILKEGRFWKHYNRDYMVVNHFKDIFGLNKLTMRRVRMNKKCVLKNKTMFRVTNNIKWVNAQNIVYCMMDKIESENLKLRRQKMTEDMKREFIKIGLFRGIFRVSGFHHTNILVEEGTNKLFSIDENHIGKRASIFMWEIKHIKKYMTKEFIDDIFSDWNVISDTWLFEQIKQKMKEYEFDNYAILEIINNYKNLRKDAYCELGL